MNIQLDHLHLLYYLNKNDMVLSKAAKEMRLSQPSASRKLKELEHLIGTPLIKRRGKRLIEFTPFATRLMNDVEAIETSISNINKIANEKSNASSQHIRVVTTHTQAKYFLPRIIELYKRNWKKVRIALHQTAPGNIAREVADGNADIAICSDLETDQYELNAAPLYSSHYCICVRKNHPLSQGDLTLDRISQFPIITYENNIAAGKLIRRAFLNGGHDLNISMAATDADIIKELVRAEGECGIINAINFNYDLDDDLALRAISAIEKSTVFIGWNRSVYLQPHIRSFVEAIKRGSLYFDSKIHEINHSHF